MKYYTITRKSRFSVIYFYTLLLPVSHFHLASIDRFWAARGIRDESFVNFFQDGTQMMYIQTYFWSPFFVFIDFSDGRDNTCSLRI